MTRNSIQERVQIQRYFRYSTSNLDEEETAKNPINPPLTSLFFVSE